MNVNHKKEVKRPKMNLIHFRKERGITQAKFAKLLNVDQSTVSKWERGSANPSIDTLKKIASVLGCSVDDLLNEKEEV